MRIAKNLLFTCLAVLVIVLAACKNDGGDPPGLNFPNNTEETTGRPNVTGTNITLTGEGAAAINIPQQILQNGAGNFSVTNGKLSFNLGTPTSLFSVTSIGLKMDPGYEITFSDPSTQVLAIDQFWYTSRDRLDYVISRYTVDTDEATYYAESYISYIYVDRDCTFSREELSWTYTDDDGSSYTVNYKALNLPLKAGWNLMQEDLGGTLTEANAGVTIITAKIADKDIPWTIEKRYY
jgi:hypothetical protein